MSLFGQGFRLLLLVQLLPGKNRLHQKNRETAESLVLHSLYYVPCGCVKPRRDSTQAVE